MNNTLQVAGSSGYQNIEPPERATRWTNGSPESLGTLGTDSQARATNNLGNVAGYSYVNGQPHAFFWSPQGGMVDMTPGNSAAYGYGLNDSNQATGVDAGLGQAFRWNNGRLQRLGVAPRWAKSYGYAINKSGQVAGSVKNAIGNSESFAIYTDGSGWNVIAVPGSPNQFRGINANGDAVGIGHFTYPQQAYVYLNRVGLYSLTELVATKDWLIYDAWDINNAGQIIGYGQATDNTGRVGAVLLTPSSPSKTAPTITGFTPAKGPVGQSVTITGTNFTNATAVTFGGTSAAFTVVSDTQISTSVPSGARTGPIAVTTPIGIAISASNFWTTPTITGFTPSQGAVGQPVTVTGTNFTGATGVTFGRTSAAFTLVSDTQISTRVPSGALTGRIAVTTPGGTAPSASDFRVKPTIQSFTPASGPVGTTVVITGSAFTGASAVTFNGNSASFVVNSYGQITATVPAGATTGPISVTTPGGSGTSRTNFVVT